MTTSASPCFKPAAVALAIWATALPALAQDAAAPSFTAPFGECALGQWTSNRNLDERANITSAGCVMNWKPKFGNDLRLGLNARAGWQDQGVADGASGRVREAYVDFDAEPFSLRAGRQIIAWGRADRINPTDSLSPRDFTLLVPDDEQQRNGIDALRLRYAINPELSVTAVVAKSEAHVTPAGSLPPNLVLAEPPRDTEWALKLDHSGSGSDWSVSYFDGLSRAVRYRLDFTNPRSPLFRGDIERVQKLGADFAVAKGAWTLRGEIAHSRISASCAACPSDVRRVSSAVLGGDVDFAETMNFNVQVFCRSCWPDRCARGPGVGSEPTQHRLRCAGNRPDAAAVRPPPERQAALGDQCRAGCERQQLHHPPTPELRRQRPPAAKRWP
jgi:hypothetical protein